MLKVLLLGDSFSDPTWAKNDYSSWPELLSQNYTVTNLSRPGSSTWWSFQQYQKLHDDFDYIIFTVTVPDRYYAEPVDKHLNGHSVNYHRNVMLEEMYYEVFHSPALSNYLQSNIINDLTAASNVLLVPAFYESIPAHTGLSLCYLADLESDFYKVPKPIINDKKRKCHLGRENNIMVYNKIVTAITTGTHILSLNLTDYITPTDLPEFYWT